MTRRAGVALPAAMAALLLGINGLFLLKYLDGVTPLPAWLPALGYTLAGAAALGLAAAWMHRRPPSPRAAGALLVLLLATFVVTALVLLATIDRMSVDVDRWSAIEHWLDRLLAGGYPYDARTHLGQAASPFPTWQLLHLPWYLLGDVGLGQVVALPLVASITVLVTRRVRAGLLFTAVMLASPAFWYEVAVRSDLSSNLLLATALVVVLGARPGMVRRHPWPVAVAVGLALSTRLLVAIPIAAATAADAWALRREPRGAVVGLLVMALSFGVTFLPFVLWDVAGGAFLRSNPFVLQTNKLDTWVVALALGSASLLAFWARTLGERLAAGALSLGGMMLALLVLGVARHGGQAIADDLVDLAYVATPLPLAALAWALHATGTADGDR